MVYVKDEKSVVIDKRGPLSKIEKAGPQVSEHLIELCKNTDLSYEAMAKRINEKYELKLNRMDICRFFKANGKLIEKYIQEKKSLNALRAKLSLDYTEHLVTDIKALDKGIQELQSEEGRFIEPDKKWRQVADLIDKKGKLLLREAKLSGKLFNDGGISHTNIDNMNVNIVDGQSELVQRLKKFETKKVIDAKPDEKQETDS